MNENSAAQLLTGFDRISGDSEYLLRPSGVAGNLSWGYTPEVRRAEIRGRRPRAERDVLGRGSLPLPPAKGSAGASSSRQQMHFGRIKSPENASNGCKYRFSVENRCVMNHMRNYQAAEKT